ncbi:hypothetical protein [Streptomyces albipurpureus]|uniref:Secreted protein n=1 Tax=Streptomyces albipurpureus TaxID=2897419 RepID=A0ABT0UIR1_9ACTN|nr:hypothetical protein [Streptomyces sp. CWNU-1]MCM2388216.1 hypothetical protein [Streptomyces sp. CWNU-1]
MKASTFRVGGFLGALMLGASILATPAIAAGSESDDALACVGWNKTRTEGGGSGQICNGNTASGTIYDARADGRCPFIKFYYAGGGHKQSPQVGPAGTSRSFTVYADAGRYFNGTASAEWRSC